MLMEASEGAQPHQYLDFGFLAIRAGREQISVAWSPLVCGRL